MNIHIYHHYDADGYGSAAIIASQYLTLSHFSCKCGKITLKERNNCQEEFCTSCFTRPVIHNFSFEEPLYFHKCDHKNPAQFSEIEENDIVYIVDYSPMIEEIGALEKIEKAFQNIKIIWIDHHVTSETLIQQFPFMKKFAENGIVLASGEKDHNFSGVALCNWWVTKRLCESCGVTTKDIGLALKEAPRWIQLINDYDLWIHNDPNSKFFTSGLLHKGLENVFIRPNDPENSLLLAYALKMRLSLRDALGEDYTNYISMCETTLVENLISNGKFVQEIDSNKNKAILKSNGFAVHLDLSVRKEFIDPDNLIDFKEITDDYGFIKVEGNVRILNYYGNSMVFGENYDGADAVILFNYNGDVFKYSMYSSKETGMRCNVFALYFLKMYNISGGGHDHAAGWATKEFVFEKDRVYLLREDGIRNFPI